MSILYTIKVGERQGVLAQLGEHLPYKQRVTGSSPVGPMIKLQNGHYGEIAQLARARGSYPRCRGFESPSRYSRGVAQVVERFVRDEEAASSSLVTPTENL